MCTLLYVSYNKYNLGKYKYIEWNVFYYNINYYNDSIAQVLF